MRTNFIINPRYKEIKSFLKSIPEIFDYRGEIIHQNRRNTIKVIENNGLKFNVKNLANHYLLIDYHILILEILKPKGLMNTHLDLTLRAYQHQKELLTLNNLMVA